MKVHVAGLSSLLLVGLVLAPGVQATNHEIWECEVYSDLVVQGNDFDTGEPLACGTEYSCGGVDGRDCRMRLTAILGGAGHAHLEAGPGDDVQCTDVIGCAIVLDVLVPVGHTQAFSCNSGPLTFAADMTLLCDLTIRNGLS